VLLAGLRRRRLFESLLFFTAASMFLYYSGQLLGLNIHVRDLQSNTLPLIGTPPSLASRLAYGLQIVGLLLLSPLIVHCHVEFLKRVKGVKRNLLLHAVVLVFYVEGLANVALKLDEMAFSIPLPAGFLLLSGQFLHAASWFVAGLIFSAVLQFSMSRAGPQAALRRLHVLMGVVFISIAGAFVGMTFARQTILLFQLALLLPGIVLGYFAVRNRFFPLGVQRSLVMTASAAFLALLYLTLVRRAGMWFEGFLPPVATESVLIFVLVIFFEPLQRRVSRALERVFRGEAEKLQRLVAEIQQVARSGNLAELVEFSERRIRETFAVAGVRISLAGGPPRPAVSGNMQRYLLRSGEEEIGALEAFYFGQALSGETSAALDYLAEQLPAAIDLCQLLDEKLRLERDLAEHERLALLGQMAASISHNLRNPLGAMKTLLQVQLENPELPSAARSDCQRVIAEIDRLTAKLTQLLRYSRPAVRDVSAVAVAVDVRAAIGLAVGLLRHDAEKRSILLEAEIAPGELLAAGDEEALGEILSNLIVNALDAALEGGAVRVAARHRDANIEIEIADNGPGIAAEVREKIFQPFFTTKSRGTGLGLAIVARRVEELGGEIRCESPAAQGKGTRFIVALRAWRRNVEAGK
jgi:signal transduction histidine kinase